MFNDIGFTGSRQGISIKQERLIREFLSHVADGATFHHGCCVGSDENFHQLIRQIFVNAEIIGHPPTDQSLVAEGLEYDKVFDPKPYLVRNRHIVDSSEILLATPAGPEYQRSGTWSTIRYALTKNIPVYIFR